MTCAEIADDPEIVARLRKLYDQVDRGTTPATVLFPWFPSPSMVMKALATKRLYDIMVKAINVRKESGVPHDDTLQTSLDAGEDLLTIVGVCTVLPKFMRHSCRHAPFAVYDGFRNGRRAVYWYRRRVLYVMMSSYCREKLTLSQLPGCSPILVVILNGATKHAQKSGNWSRLTLSWRPSPNAIHRTVTRPRPPHYHLSHSPHGKMRHPSLTNSSMKRSV